MSRCLRGWKMLNENLAPLKRFLRSNVGRPWDQVFAEICEHISVNSAVQKHVRDHLGDLVVRNVRRVDGVLYGTRRRWQNFPLEPTRRDILYVCERTGLLRVLLHRCRQPPQPSRDYRWADQRTCFAKVNGAWFIFTVARCEPSWQAPLIFGRRGIQIVSKRQLSKRDIRDAGLIG